MDTRPNTSQQRALDTRKVNIIPGCTTQSAGCSLREDPPTLFSAGEATPRALSSFGFLGTRETLQHWKESNKGVQR